MKLLTPILLLIILTFQAFPQNPEWLVFDSTNSPIKIDTAAGDYGWIMLSLAIDKNNNKWIGTSEKGIAKFDDVNWTVYDNSNSCVNSNPYSDKYQIHADTNNNIWYYHAGQIDRFDGSNCFSPTTDKTGYFALDDSNFVWYTTYYTNFPQPTICYGLKKYNQSTDSAINYNPMDYLPSLQDSCVSILGIDKWGNVWLEAENNSLIRFDRVNWSLYNNVFIGWFGPDRIASDNSNNTWFATEGGLLKFDGNGFTTLNSFNSCLPSDTIYSIAIDSVGNKWIGCSKGLVKLANDSTCIIYNYMNTPISSFTGAGRIMIDKYDNKWFFINDNRLAVYRKGGVYLSADERTKNNTSALEVQIYPNPVKKVVYINYYITQASTVKIDIYNIYDQLSAEIFNSCLLPGYY